MKKILILVEKKSLVENLVKTEMFKEFSNNNKVTIVSFYGFGLFKFSYPKNIPYAKYPTTHIPQFKPTTNDSLNNYENTFKELRKKYDTIIIIADYDYAGVFSSNLCLEYSLNNWRDNHQYYYVSSKFGPTKDVIDNFKIQIINNNKEEIDNMKLMYLKFLEQGKIKRYFEYNFNMNSQLFFNEILNYLDIKENITITKYMILLLHLLNKKNQPITYFNARKLMNNYNGTGKYDNIGIGTPASSPYIIENLCMLKLVDINENTLTLSTLGHQFLKLLSKKTFDPDIVGRLWSWMNLNNKEEAIKKIDSYIKNYFQEQKRKNKFLNGLIIN